MNDTSDTTDVTETSETAETADQPARKRKGRPAIAGGESEVLNTIVPKALMADVRARLAETGSPIAWFVRQALRHELDRLTQE